MINDNIITYVGDEDITECPQCGSRTEFLLEGEILQKHKCLRCSYIFYVEFDTKAVTTRLSDLTQEQKVDTMMLVHRVRPRVIGKVSEYLTLKHGEMAFVDALIKSGMTSHQAKVNARKICS